MLSSIPVCVIGTPVCSAVTDNTGVMQLVALSGRNQTDSILGTWALSAGTHPRHEDTQLRWPAVRGDVTFKHGVESLANVIADRVRYNYDVYTHSVKARVLETLKDSAGSCTV